MKVVALAGGVGGARLADGLAQALPPEDLTVIVNTGDDFEHLGLYICPDLDTVCYTLAGLANPATGWGREGESWQALEVLAKLGGPDWFHLGDRDLGLHLERTRRRNSGQLLSQITAHFCSTLGIRSRILPMSDDSVSTWVYTTEDEALPFQEYFVHRQCNPRVTGFCFKDVEQARPAEGVLESIQVADLVVICPSNPWVSIDSILAVPGIHPALKTRRLVAVSPIIGGKTVKGPAAKMYAELGIPPSALAVAQHYGGISASDEHRRGKEYRRNSGLLSGFVMDNQDVEQAADVQALGMRTWVTGTLMKTAQDRVRLAKEVVEFGMSL